MTNIDLIKTDKYWPLINIMDTIIVQFLFF